MYLFIICALYQIVYQLLLVLAITKRKLIVKNNNSISQKSVSVVICAKNEKENLDKNLPFILNQKYNDFEVIIVDDGSDESFLRNDNQLKIITLTKEQKNGLGKKYALQKGIENASKKLILLTDADCKPVSENWITEMVSCVTDEYKIVLGISPYKQENTFLNALVEYETAQTALQYIGFALLKMPYMCVGRNVLYDTALLKTLKWTDDDLYIASGDDDLAIQKLATINNITVCISNDSYTTSEAKKTWSSWFYQKLRHYETGNKYRFLHQLLLGSYLTTKLLMLLLFFILINSNFSFVIAIYLFYFISIILINYNINYFLQLNSRWYLAFIYDILYCIFTISLGIVSYLKPIKNWK